MSYNPDDYSNLVGTKIFKGVAFVPGGTLVKLDDKVYFLYEDEDDGYRSHGVMQGEIDPNKYPNTTFNMEDTPIEVDVVFEDRVFCGIKVYGSAATKSNFDDPICELGTDNTDDYYPMYISHFDAEQATKVRMAQLTYIGELILLDKEDAE